MTMIEIELAWVKFCEEKNMGPVDGLNSRRT